MSLQPTSGVIRSGGSIPRRSSRPPLCASSCRMRLRRVTMLSVHGQRRLRQARCLGRRGPGRHLSDRSGDESRGRPNPGRPVWPPSRRRAPRVGCRSRLCAGGLGERPCIRRRKRSCPARRARQPVGERDAAPIRPTRNCLRSGLALGCARRWIAGRTYRREHGKGSRPFCAPMSASRSPSPAAACGRRLGTGVFVGSPSCDREHPSGPGLVPPSLR